jgi:hypothetical protein
MNKELMMKAVVKFKGVWPSGDETHLYKFSHGNFETGIKVGTVELAFIREQFESFVESLFEGAPEGATHVDAERVEDYYKYDGYAYYLIGKIHSVRCANFDKLIPRPAKKAEPEAQYMPKVGEECEINHLGNWFKISKTDFYDRYAYACGSDFIFRPLRTEEEIKRDRLAGCIGDIFEKHEADVSGACVSDLLDLLSK